MDRLTILFLLLLNLEAGAQINLPSRNAMRDSFTAGTYRSASGQFVVHGPPPRDRYYGEAFNDTKVDWVRLEPALLAVTCERVKKAVLTTLGITLDQWRDTIAVHLHPAAGLGDTVAIAVIRDRNRWNYEVEMPDVLERSEVVAAIVHAMLIEMANRETERAAEIPAWLVQGMARELIGGSTIDLVVEPPNKGRMSARTRNFAAELTKRDGYWVDPLTQAHDQLSTMPVATLDELFWPTPAQAAGSAAGGFGASAQLLLHGLLTVDNGRPDMVAFIRTLARHYNWQLSFFPAFQAHFASQLELEKWWALQAVTFTGRNLRQLWSPEESAKRVTEGVRVAVEVRTSTNELPLLSQLTLQAIIRDWDFARQQAVVQVKLNELILLRTRVDSTVAPVVDGYREALESYLKKEEKDSVTPMGKAMRRPGVDEDGREAIRELDLLDAHLKEYLRKPTAVTVSR